jgi:LysM repeat protein
MIALITLITSLSFTPTPADSIGKEIINGKVFVLHRVELKETLYGISKRYGTTVEAILQQNPTADGGLEIDQILKVPYVSSPKKPASNGKHIVAEKETLYSIARMYGLTVDELRKMNSLTDTSLSLGQELVVKKSGTASEAPYKANPTPAPSDKGVHTVAAKETLFSIAKQYGISVKELKEWNNLSTNELKLGQTLRVIAPVAATPVVAVAPISQEPVKTASPTATTTPNTPPVISTPIKISEGYKDGKEVRETGLAELIEGTQGNRKYLALHRTAPTGTILKIKNQMNDREVFVRVIGQLPDTGTNDKLVIKISKSAYDRLSAIDPKFMVEVTWYK